MIMTSSLWAHLAYLLPLLPIFLPTTLVWLGVCVVLCVCVLLQCTLQSGVHTSVITHLSLRCESYVALIFLSQSTTSEGSVSVSVCSFIYSAASGRLHKVHVQLSSLLNLFSHGLSAHYHTVINIFFRMCECL